MMRHGLREIERLSAGELPLAAAFAAIATPRVARAHLLGLRHQPNSPKDGTP